MKLSDLDVLLPQDPPSAKLAARWALVTTASPLRVQLDGDTAPLPLTPVTLAAGLTAGSRVLCLLIGRQLVVLGTPA